MSKFVQGKYKLKNPQKYVGDPNNVVFRSSWEMRCCKFFDENKNIVKWASEELSIEYPDPANPRKIRRYFPDFIIQCLQPDGSKKMVMIEVKPDAQTRPPELKKRKTKRYLEEMYTYKKNEYKWKAAQNYCAAKGWEFQIWTEKNMRFTG